MLVQESTIAGCSQKSSLETSLPRPRPSQAYGFANPLWKRLLDLGLIIVAAPLWLPVMLLIAAAIKLLSKGPVIFRQERVGLNGTSFCCLKFRSMRCDADIKMHKEHLCQLMTSDAPLAKLDRSSDPRLIPFGDALRASGLDELPQLFNVIRGDMSLVGPRPCIIYEYERYQLWQKERFGVLPGLTGLWQVTGKNRTTFAQMVELDIQYANQLSMRQDLLILLKTFKVVVEQVAELLTRKSKAARTLLSKNGTCHEKGH